jgi:hypothetical protein
MRWLKLGRHLGFFTGVEVSGRVGVVNANVSEGDLASAKQLFNSFNRRPLLEHPAG